MERVHFLNGISGVGTMTDTSLGLSGMLYRVWVNERRIDTGEEYSHECFVVARERQELDAGVPCFSTRSPPKDPASSA